VISNHYHLPEKTANPQLSPGAKMVGWRATIVQDLTMGLRLFLFPHVDTEQPGLQRQAGGRREDVPEASRPTGHWRFRCQTTSEWLR